MLVKNIIDSVVPSIWPLIVFITIIAVIIRGAYLIEHNDKFVIYKELLMLIFIIYILCLYYLLFNKDMSNAVNLVPFREISRYEVGSNLFVKNILSKMVIFIPFGFFAAYYLETKKTRTNLVVLLLTTVSLEVLSYYLGTGFNIDYIILHLVGGFIGYLLLIAWFAIKSKLPKFMRRDSFLSILVIVLVILAILFIYNIDIFSYLEV